MRAAVRCEQLQHAGSGSRNHSGEVNVREGGERSAFFNVPAAGTYETSEVQTRGENRRSGIRT